MKRVVCISENWGGDTAAFIARTGITPPVFGKTYTVTDEGKCDCGKCNNIVYSLLEINAFVDGLEIGWNAKNFAEVSEIDETEMLRKNVKLHTA